MAEEKEVGSKRDEDNIFFHTWQNTKKLKGKRCTAVTTLKAMKIVRSALDFGKGSGNIRGLCTSVGSGICKELFVRTLHPLFKRSEKQKVREGITLTAIKIPRTACNSTRG